MTHGVKLNDASPYGTGVFADPLPELAANEVGKFHIRMSFPQAGGGGSLIYRVLSKGLTPGYDGGFSIQQVLDEAWVNADPGGSSPPRLDISSWNWVINTFYDLTITCTRNAGNTGTSFTLEDGRGNNGSLGTDVELQPSWTMLGVVDDRRTGFTIDHLTIDFPNDYREYRINELSGNVSQPLRRNSKLTWTDFARVSTSSAGIQRNDAQHAGIIAKTSETDGANDDLEMAYLLTLPGVTQANIKDMWRQVFDASASGSANKHYNDAAFIWLGAAGQTAPTLDERWIGFWNDLATP